MAGQMKYTLSDKEKKFYHDNGYLVVSGLIDFETLYTCKRHFINICRGRVNKGNIVVMKEVALLNTGAKGEELINKIQDILFDETFAMYTEHPKLMDVLSQFLGKDIVAVHSMLINKPPGTTEHPPHQDLYYFPFRPADKIIASWTAIDEVRRDNGCLWVVPGSHRGRLFRHGYPEHMGVVNKAYHGILQAGTAAPQEQRVHLEMQPGDTVFFHPILVHGSGPNRSKNYRKAISCHYASGECHYIDVKGTVQEPIANEVVEMAKSRGYDNITFVDVWKHRSKLVKGLKSNL